MKMIPEILGAKDGVSASWTYQGAEVIFTAPDMETLTLLLTNLGAKDFDPTKSCETLTFPKAKVMERFNQKYAGAKGSA